MILSDQSYTSLASISLLLYISSIIVYRLYLHPLAAFPGPRLAAITQWYEFYWNVIQPGQFTFHIQDLHKVYGPVVRINPWELHICDPEFFKTIYPWTRHDKSSQHLRFFDAPSSIVATPDRDLHHQRRAAAEPSFNKASVRTFVPHIQAAVDTVIARLDKEYSGREAVATLSDVFACYGGHVVAEFCFSWDGEFLSSPKFKAPLLTAFDEFMLYTHYIFHFGFLLPLFNFIPDKLLPATAQTVHQFQEAIRCCIKDLQSETRKADVNTGHKPVMETLLNSKLPAQEKTLERLNHEGYIMFAAGQSTPRVLTTAMFHLLQQPATMQRLRDEILNVFPDQTVPPSLPQLEKLPFLTAVIMEALRLSYGSASRSPRIAHKPLLYGPYTIPANTPTSMSNYSVHSNPQLFPDPFAFIAERWLDDPTAPTLNTPAATEKTQQLSRYMVTFGKGSRQCIGMHLAWAQLYLMLASAVRRCEFQLYETRWEDVGFLRDYAQTFPAAESKGLRVKVKNVV